MISKPLILFMVSMTFVIWQWVQPLNSPGMEKKLSPNQTPLEVGKGEDSEEVISQKDGAAGWTRDPFSLPPGIRRKSEMEESRKIQPERKPIKVEGVLVSGTLKRVIIDDKILSIGDMLENWRIMDIQRRSVILDTEEGRIEIPISESPIVPGSGI